MLLVSTKDLASHVGVTPQRINQYAGLGMPKKDRDKWDLDRCCKWIRRYEQEQIEKQQSKKADEADYWTQQTRFTMAKAELAEDRLRRERGDLVPLPALLTLLDRTIGSFKNQMLGLGSNLAPKLEGLDAGGRRKLIDKEVRARLTELSRSKPRTLDLRRLGSIGAQNVSDGDTAPDHVPLAVGGRPQGDLSRK